MRRSLIALIALSLLTSVAAACGDDDGDADAPVSEEGGGASSDVDELAEDLGVDDMVESQEAAQEAQGGGHATITIGDQTWEFDSVLCNVGPSETGRDDTEFVLSSIQDGLQLDATINTEFGHSISLNDIEDLANPSVSYGFTDIGAVTGGEITEVIQVDGKDVYAEAAFYDDTSESFEEIPGELTATCP
ncbi:hypothetical protein [Actinomarinicola tropica]|uniref:Lipoprotein n=1 Tax=Actinomarinicola tropica TaxID=2789776 RepID=A0A5Q2RKW3_9ACTN|nr:hypothetical protein [Actinomarinicola tropica]QGG94697.1 hypothetical protein GH723_05990 [Actinomarinicola tropica]